MKYDEQLRPGKKTGATITCQSGGRFSRLLHFTMIQSKAMVLATGGVDVLFRKEGGRDVHSAGLHSSHQGPNSLSLLRCS